MVRVLVAGSFDILHTGHIFLFQEAAKRGEVVVVVARDSSIVKIKGKPPTIPEAQRLEIVQAIKYVSLAVLGNEGEDFLAKPLSLNPDLILLGPTQKISEATLLEELKKRGASHVKIERLKAIYDKYELSSSSKIKKRIISTRNP
jgi:FAD synthetase